MRLARLHFELPGKSEPKLVNPDANHLSNLHIFLELPDQLGSETLTIDHASGELVEARTYQPYGATESDYRPDRWKGFREDYGYTGKEEDVEVGLQYFGKRFLSPYLGRWISADPLAVHMPGQADFNLYAYVSGAVLQNTDPLGLEKLTNNPNERDVTHSFSGPISVKQFAAQFGTLIRNGIADRMGIKAEQVDQRVVNIIMAQSYFETGQGAKMWNWNLTNVRANGTASKHIYLKGPDEYVKTETDANALLARSNGKGTIEPPNEKHNTYRVIFARAPTAGARFAGFDSKEEGVGGNLDEQVLKNGFTALQNHLTVKAEAGETVSEHDVVDTYYENDRLFVPDKSDPSKLVKGNHHATQNKAGYVKALSTAYAAFQANSKESEAAPSAPAQTPAGDKK